MKIIPYIHLKTFKWILCSLFMAWLMPIVASSHAQTLLNVADFGASGDAVQFFVNTTSNSVLVTTTNQLSGADIGKTIEVFGAGAPTSGIGSYGTITNANQDVVAIITNVINNTNIYISQVAQATLTNTFATYGHDNSTNFALAIAACGGTNDTINIPSGKYLLIPSLNGSAYGYASVWIRRGGIHFVGAGMTNTILLSQGAWAIHNWFGQGNAVWRGFLFEFNSPITNDYPFSIENLTMDGGVQQGLISIQGEIANLVDGLGWDQTSDAIVAWGPGNTFTDATWTNVMFTHWRGEMVKSLDGTTNGNLSILNCAFTDGNATAINFYPSLNVSNCVFSNLFQVAEYYQAYSANTSFFQNNFVTNVVGNGFAINGGKGSNPPFVIRNNMFYFAYNGQNGIETTPGDNVYIISNQFIYPVNSHGNAIVLGAPGAQGTFCNSNIVVEGNALIEAATFLSIASGNNATALQRTVSVDVFKNMMTNTALNAVALNVNGWATNVHYFSNDFSGIVNGAGFSSGANGSPYALVDTNNIFYSKIYNYAGANQNISYAHGSRYEVVNAFTAGGSYALTDTDSNQIPAGAQMLLKNNNTSFVAIPVYLNSAMTRGPIMVANGDVLSIYWSNSSWIAFNSTTSTNNGSGTTNIVISTTNTDPTATNPITPITNGAPFVIPPPTNLHVIYPKNKP